MQNLILGDFCHVETKHLRPSVVPASEVLVWSGHSWKLVSLLDVTALMVEPGHAHCGEEAGSGTRSCFYTHVDTHHELHAVH